MRKSIFFYKELTPAEVGKTGTHEVYVRLPNNFAYEDFFANSAVMNGSVMEVNFTAQDITNGGEEPTPLRFVYFINSNQEKRIPSLGALFKSHNVQEGDIVSLESRSDGTSISYYLCFYKKGEIQISPASIYFTKIESNVKKTYTEQPLNLSLQKIFYGAPGTGKSHIIKEQTKGQDVVRTTFHPDTDYSTFVGAYKPTTEEVPVLAIVGDRAVPTDKMEKRISYEFVSQAFLQAYVGAWQKIAEANLDEPKKQFLVIEEINRGNCAQIFGDLFQLLDRNDKGFSDYPINADADMQKQLKALLGGLTIENADAINALYDDEDIVAKVLNGEVLLLPNNLYIWATMNTSDQSLFPIDSAFKRRWDWQYMPISEGRDEHGQPNNWRIEADTQAYSWWSFLTEINKEIYDKTHSEDKKLGYYFCKAQDGVIKVESFVSKVLFYLWNDVFKDFDSEGSLFEESYDKLYDTDSKGKVIVVKEKVQRFLDNLKVQVVDDLSDTEEEEDDTDTDNNSQSGGKDFTRYTVNGEGNYPKRQLAMRAVKKFIELHPDMPAEEVVQQWASLGNLVSHFVETQEQYDARTDQKPRVYDVKCGDTFIYVSWNGWGLTGTMDKLISGVNSKNWGITLAVKEA